MAVSHANPKSNLAIAQERSAKVSYAKQHPQSMFQYFSNSKSKQQATRKIWSLYSFEGFLLYIRDIVKITKTFTDNQIEILKCEKKQLAAPTQVHSKPVSGIRS